MTPLAVSPSPRFELWFLSLSDRGRGRAFPCDADGRVDLDCLSGRARNDYFFAHSVIGREVASPQVFTLASQGLDERCTGRMA
jgi:hypothetical protein